jgi:transcriptional antiterminator NusG
MSSAATNFDRLSHLSVPKVSVSSTYSGWFVVQVAHQRERRVAMMLENKGYEQFVPSRASKRKFSGHICKEQVLFPGYLFCRARTNISGLIVTTPGVIRILGPAGSPTIVPEQQMRNIWLIVNAGVPAEAHETIEVGSLVRIIDGPLTGLEGTLVQRKSQQKIAVAVTLLRRSISVGMAAWHVQEIPSFGRGCSSDSTSGYPKGAQRHGEVTCISPDSGVRRVSNLSSCSNRNKQQTA